ncbi:MAG: putative baseplate assembly protein [Chthoniobacterales bacterium]|nr:putative baseplate assembly protein [Chthoniobacterales bacterium]
MDSASSTCGCCEGLEKLTPASLANRPGLDALLYRAGTYSTFFETMLARLSNLAIEVPNAGFDSEGKPILPLTGLTTRDSGDPAIALLDAWATVADVLTFYDERLANEGYLRTATERRSVLELARLIGYTPRPGVAATAYFAYTIDEDRSVTPAKGMEVTIPAGSRAQSVPEPNELPQSFETAEALRARTAWNKLQPRLSRPQTAESMRTKGLYFKGIATNLKPNDPILIDFGEGMDKMIPLRVVEVTADTSANRTHITVRPLSDSKKAVGADFVVADAAFEPGSALVEEGNNAIKFVDSLKKAPSIPPPNTAGLDRTLNTAFAKGADVFPRMLTTFRPALGNVLKPAIANATVAPSVDIKVYALRVSASLFGHSAPAQPLFDGDLLRGFEPPNLENTMGELALSAEGFLFVALDAEYDQIKTKSFMLIDRPILAKGESPQGAPRIPPNVPDNRRVTIHSVERIETATMAVLGVSAKASVATIERPWFSDARGDADVASKSTAMLRATRVFAQSELLPLAEIPIPDPICDAEIELDDFYDELEAGRWVIVSGERSDVLDVNGGQVPGIKSAELAMLLSVSHRVVKISPNDESPVLPGDKTHTFITLSTKPAYCYARDKMTIYGNVIKATHGETRKEVLGSGDASKPMQTFALRQPPLTFLAVPTAAGAASTLVLRVNEVEWHETDTLAGLAPDDRKFITKIDDESKTTVIFGNGREGARPPTGRENVTAVYRNGIGRPGNVKAGQINQLTTRPLGVKEVINPLPSTGGADREDRDQARKNAPLGVLALDRLVSVQDYADFTRTFAGIGKASAVKLSDGAREVIHVTIAGANDIPIEKHSDLYQNLMRTLRSLGDPHLPIEVELREMLALIISANVRVLPDYAWEFIEPKIRTRLLEAFSFERRDLAQDVTKSEVISVMQCVRGVAYVDLDLLAAVSESDVEAELIKTTINAGKVPADDEKSARLPSFSESLVSVQHRVVVQPARANSKARNYSERRNPAQVAVLSPALSETLVLTEVKG